MKLTIYLLLLFEIKNRGWLLLITGISVILTSYFYKEVLLFTICSNSSFSYIYTNITEVFSIYVNLISFISIQIVLGYFFFHFFIFLGPGLYNKEYYYTKTFFYFNFFLTIFSIFFFNTVVFPSSCEFFLSFQNTIFKPLNFYFEAKINDYLNFYFFFYYICFFYSQFFICLTYFFYVLDRKMKEIKFFRKIFCFFICIISIFMSYVDITLQILFSINLFIFYELAVLKFLITKNFKTANSYEACSSVGRTFRS